MTDRPDSAPPAAPAPPSAWTNPKLLHMATLSLPGAVPLAVVLTTIPAWLTVHGIDAKAIGLFALAGLPWSLKFLWSPLVDRIRFPFGGRRRGWIIAMQIALLIAIAALPHIGATRVAMVIAISTLIAFFSATQDIAMDAYAVELMQPHEQGPGNALRVTFYRIGMLAAGGAAVAVAEFYDWKWVYLGVALVMVPAVFLTAAAPEPEVDEPPVTSLTEAVIAPLSSFIRRPDAWAIAGLILLYKVGDNMVKHMLPPFFLDDLGMSLAEFGVAQKTVGMVAVIVGTLLGGAILEKLDLKKALLLFGIFQAVANLLYSATAWSGGNRVVLYAALAIEQGCGGMGTAALLTLITRICDKRSAATQFALLTSLFGLGRTFAGPPSGYLVAGLGYPLFFAVTALCAVPALVLLAFIDPNRKSEP